MPQFTTEKRLYLNADKSCVVEEDDPEAAFLLAAEGQQVSAEDAKRYGLSKAAQKEEADTDTDTDAETELPADVTSEAGMTRGKAVKQTDVQDKSLHGPE